MILSIASLRQMPAAVHVDDLPGDERVFQEKENRGGDILGVSVPPQGKAPPQFFQK
jgi:hypothetical protein